MTQDLKVVRHCIRTCAAARDGRGRWRIERDTALRLRALGSTPAIALATAAAAASFGAWLRHRLPPAQP